MRELLKYIFGPVPLVSATLAASAATYIGPFGSYGVMDVPARAAYWFGIVFLSLILSMGILYMVQQALPERPFWHRAMVSSGLFSVIYATILWQINMWAFADSLDSLPGWIELFAIVLFIATGINLIIYLLQPKGLELPGKPRFFKRLNPELGDELVRLSMQDHYLEVVTTRGRDLILLRFSDALDELDGYDGMQVHRSHWVARSAVTEARRNGQRLLLVTSDGAEVPVSRSMRKAVAEAGYI